MPSKWPADKVARRPIGKLIPAVRNALAATGEPTREMIEAGADVVWELRGFDPNYVAERVFLAMIAIK